MKLRLLLRFTLLALLLGTTACRRGKDDSAIDPDIYTDLPPISDFDSLDDGTGLPEGRGDIASMQPVDSSTLTPVYFAFDSSTLSLEELAKVNTAVSMLQSNLGYAVVLQGHSDERGSREYNLALGERRALAVRDVLLSMGISSDRIQTLSYGEEMPAVEGFGESAWSLNRRVEFQLMQ